MERDEKDEYIGIEAGPNTNSITFSEINEDGDRDGRTSTRVSKGVIDARVDDEER